MGGQGRLLCQGEVLCWVSARLVRRRLHEWASCVLSFRVSQILTMNTEVTMELRKKSFQKTSGSSGWYDQMLAECWKALYFTSVQPFLFKFLSWQRTAEPVCVWMCPFFLLQLSLLQDAEEWSGRPRVTWFWRATRQTHAASGRCRWKRTSLSSSGSHYQTPSSTAPQWH